jgi:hypothetical protein
MLSPSTGIALAPVGSAGVSPSVTPARTYRSWLSNCFGIVREGRGEQGGGRDQVGGLGRFARDPIACGIRPDPAAGKEPGRE